MDPPDWPRARKGGISIENDLCVDATPLLPGETVSGTTDSDQVTTYDEGFGSHQYTRISDAPGVWYSVIGNGNWMLASTCHPGTNYDTRVTVYCGSCDRPAMVAGNRRGEYDSGFDEPVSCVVPEIHPDVDQASTVRWCSQPGVDYRIYVGGDGILSIGGADQVVAAKGDYELSVQDLGLPCQFLAEDMGHPDWVGDRSALQYRHSRVDCGAGNALMVLGASLTDDGAGDGDALADSGETLDLRLRVRNFGSSDLTGVVARIASIAPEIVDIPVDNIVLGTILAGEIVDVSEPFRIVVGDVPRKRADERLSALFEIAFTSDRWDFNERPQSVSVELAYDLSGGAGPTTFFEGFESGDLGAFAPMHLDRGRDSDVNADGFRCPYDRDNSFAPTCYFTPEAVDEFYWQVEGPESPAGGGRSFSGAHSAYWGGYVGSRRGHPLAALEAIYTAEPISLNWGRTCSVTQSQRCAEDNDCPGSESCLEVQPELSFKHQADLFGQRKLCRPCDEFSCSGTLEARKCVRDADCAQGERCTHLFNVTDNSSAVRGVVQVQLANQDGSPAGPWTNLEPHINPYESVPGIQEFQNCSFDPIDDGNSEDDTFGPDVSDWAGPSSTCYPQRTFNNQGDSVLPFDPDHVGLAGDGPALEGETGLGSWIDARVSLERFRGRRIRLRFLVSGFSAGNTVFPPPGWGYGWWIDDVTVTHVLTSPAKLAVDGRSTRVVAKDGAQAGKGGQR